MTSRYNPKSLQPPEDTAVVQRCEGKFDATYVFTAIWKHASVYSQVSRTTDTRGPGVDKARTVHGRPIITISFFLSLFFLM